MFLRVFNLHTADTPIKMLCFDTFSGKNTQKHSIFIGVSAVCKIYIPRIRLYASPSPSYLSPRLSNTANIGISRRTCNLQPRREIPIFARGYLYLQCLSAMARANICISLHQQPRATALKHCKYRDVSEHLQIAGGLKHPYIYSV